MKSKESRFSVIVPMGMLEDEYEDDIAMEAEEWMDMEFGVGGWVRDSWCDRFIALDYEYQGPGTGYVVFDRQRRRSTTVVYKHQVH